MNQRPCPSSSKHRHSPFLKNQPETLLPQRASGRRRTLPTIRRPAPTIRMVNENVKRLLRNHWAITASPRAGRLACYGTSPPFLRGIRHANVENPDVAGSCRPRRTWPGWNRKVFRLAPRIRPFACVHPGRPKGMAASLSSELRNSDLQFVGIFCATIERARKTSVSSLATAESSEGFYLA